MDKMKFETPDMTAENIEKIAELFPNCVTEMRDENGKIKRGINFEMLKQMLSSDVVDGDECYEFTWVGKKASIVEANKPIRKTLRPCPEESKNWDTTENLYIEGDNLEVLKLLQESYLGKVKMIYIDPPYNTGNDFIYADDFMRSQEEENEQMGMYDEDENRLFKNTDSNGRFHSDWCSMMYSRLMLARNLLADDGVIFISIDNNEQANLKKISDEILGEKNFISVLSVENNPKGRKNNAFISESFEYCLVYVKNKNAVYEKIAKQNVKKFFKGIESDDNRMLLVDEYGYFKQSKRQVSGTNKSNALAKDSNPERRFVIYYKKAPNEDVKLLNEYDEKSDDWGVSEVGKTLLISGYTRYCCYNSETGKPAIPLYSKETIIKLFNEHSLYFKEDGTIYEKDRDNEQQITSMLTNKKFNLDLMTESATSKLEELFGGKKVFTNSKAIDFIKALVKLYPSNDLIVIDFFSGSATTSHAVMQLNAEDGGKRKFIMVQLPEVIDPKKEATEQAKTVAQNAINLLESLGAPHNLCEIGKERIRRAGEKIKAENSLTTKDLDVGFRVLKLDDSNMKDVYYAADEYDQRSLLDMVSNIKDDRNDLDLLFGCLLDWGLPLSLPYKSEQIEGCTVHSYNDGDLIACFDNNIPESVIREIAKRKPLRAVFRDSGFADSPAKINVFEIFKLYMPEDADDISKRVRVI